MSNKSEKAARRTVIIALVLVIALLITGTVLRMHSHDMNFADAMVSFLSDTFHP